MADDLLPIELPLADRLKYYRAQVAFLRARARLQLSAEARDELDALAANYESLAAHVEAQLSTGPKSV